MQKRKGFTLVELVIVIAVIAILAGVLIGTFASVLSKANESARMQEMKAAEHDQKASDILTKLNNAQWFGWEDLETKIGEAIQTAIAAKLDEDAQTAISKTDLDQAKVAVINAIDSAIAKYAQAAGQENTQLTAEQVKYIVEQAVSKSGGVTEAQVKAIVQSALQGVSTLSAAQVQRIVDTATNKVTASGLTAADLAQALANVTNKNDVNTVLTAIENATKGKSTLTKEEVADIVARYVNTNGEVKGDYTWYSKEEKLDMPDTEAALQALSVLSKNGETFKGQTIKITKLLNDNATAGNIKANTEKVIELKEEWTPIQKFEGTLDGDGYTIRNVKVKVVFFGDDDCASTGAIYVTGGSSSGWYGERKAFGFIGILSGTVKDLTLEMNTDYYDTDVNTVVNKMRFGALAGVATGNSTIQNVTVTGSIRGIFVVSGMLGTISTYDGTVNSNGNAVTNKTTCPEITVTIKDCDISGVNVETKQAGKAGHVSAAALVGKLDGYYNGTLSVSNITATVGQKVVYDQNYESAHAGESGYFTAETTTFAYEVVR